MKRIYWRVAALLVLPLGFTAAMFLDGLRAPRPTAPAPLPTAAASVPGAHDPVATPRVLVADGLWAVGVEAAPGRWAAYPATTSCVWVVRDDGTPEGFVSGGHGDPATGRAVYTQLARGQTFETAACGTWVRVGDR